jgi:UDP-N-acetylglucosamine--dolichyl-phosphate N-acetylglucosaminephosphotransferase
LDAKLGKIQASYASLENASSLGLMVVSILSWFRLVDVQRDKKNKATHVNNMTLINLVLVKSGPLREDVACKRVLMIQGLCSGLAFVFRYWIVYLAGLNFDGLDSWL